MASLLSGEKDVAWADRWTASCRPFVIPCKTDNHTSKTTGSVPLHVNVIVLEEIHTTVRVGENPNGLQYVHLELCGNTSYSIIFQTRPITVEIFGTAGAQKKKILSPAQQHQITPVAALTVGGSVVPVGAGVPVVPVGADVAPVAGAGLVTVVVGAGVVPVGAGVVVVVVDAGSWCRLERV